MQDRREVPVCTVERRAKQEAFDVQLVSVPWPLTVKMLGRTLKLGTGGNQGTRLQHETCFCRRQVLCKVSLAEGAVNGARCGRLVLVAGGLLCSSRWGCTGGGKWTRELDAQAGRKRSACWSDGGVQFKAPTEGPVVEVAACRDGCE